MEQASDRPPATVRLAAAADLHCTTESRGQLQDLFARASGEADVIALCGDLTDYGLPAEAEVLAGELAAAQVPVVAVLGNHDHESGSAEEIADLLRGAGVKVLDGDAVELAGIGFAGTKGFAGGFGPHALGAWGEPAIKSFVQVAIDEALKLETAVARLRNPTRVVLLHYSPVQGTVEGEPEAIYPWLGSSRLEEPIDRYEVATVLHGHAHYGAPEARTRGGVPVYNVSLPVLQRLDPARSFRVIALPSGAPS